MSFTSLFFPIVIPPNFAEYNIRVNVSVVGVLKDSSKSIDPKHKKK